jgi:hypothetical protein
MKNGIGISMRRMKNITMNDDGKTATFGPGLISGEVLTRLAAQDKRTGRFETSPW